MAAQEPQVSSAFRWKFGTVIFPPVLSIPAAGFTGSMLGSDLMRGLREQVVAPASGDGGASDSQPDFSPYGIAHNAGGAPGKAALRDVSNDEEETAAPEPAPPPESGDILKEAPVISVEPIIAPQDVPPPPDAEAVDPAAAGETDPNSIFSLEEPAAKRPKTYRIVLGTFGDPTNADALVQDLLKDGYEPFVEAKEPAEGDSAPQYRVLIGSFNDAADAGVVADELRRLGYNAWLNTKT